MMQDVILYRNPRRLKIVEAGNLEGGGIFIMLFSDAEFYGAHGEQIGNDQSELEVGHFST